MTEKVLSRFKQKIKSLSLSPFADGRFEIFLNGRKIYSKTDTGQFPDEDVVLKAMELGN